MDLINQFIENYKKKMNFYETAGRLAAKQLESTLQAAGIRAMVTFRAKAPGRLKSKVISRNARREIPYKNMKEIYDDIADLSGVRVALYFPGDRDKQMDCFGIFFPYRRQSSSRNSPSLPPTTNVFPAIGPTIIGPI